MLWDKIKLTFFIFLFFASTIFSQLLTFDLTQEGATGCANFMNYIQPGNVTPVYAFDTFFWDGSSGSSATEENMNSVSGTAGLTYESTTFTLSYYKHINVVNPNADPTVSGERGDFRIYAGGTITIKDDDVTKLTLTNCITTNKVFWPSNLDGPDDEVTVEGSGWGTIDENNSDPDWVNEFDANGTGQVYVAYSSISPVVQNSCGSISRYNFTVSFYPSSFIRNIQKTSIASTAITEGGKNNKVTTAVDMNDINLSFDFATAVHGGQGADKDDLYAEFRTDDPGGEAPDGVNTVGSAGYWDIGTTLEEFNTDIAFDLSGYPGISDMSNIVMLRRATSDADWEEYPTQSINGNTITCTGVTAFSQWAPGSKGGDALPVELTYFEGTATEDGVVLNWETATEVNNFGFDLERRSSSLAEWEKVGFVQGHGTTNSPKQYSFTDPLNLDLNPNLTRIDYRLKQIDNDGTFAYSKIVTVDLTTITSVDDEQMPIVYSLEQNYPNPFNPSTTIKFGLPETGLVDLRVYNILGQEVAKLVNKELNAGYHEVSFGNNNFASGMYIYRINVEGKYYSVKKMLLLK
ncbi:MAG: T9SS type A sorting domain-containing protein [Melioribacteraceae bacterium]|nr:T9SS type A sorting domain-containing protein [Melioribacteraceae bacterium]